MEAGDISVLIPYQSDGGPRDEALRFVRSFYKRVLPEAEKEAEHGSRRYFRTHTLSIGWRAAR